MEEVTPEVNELEFAVYRALVRNGGEANLLSGRGQEAVAAFLADLNGAGYVVAPAVAVRHDFVPYEGRKPPEGLNPCRVCGYEHD